MISRQSSPHGIISLIRREFSLIEIWFYILLILKIFSFELPMNFLMMTWSIENLK